MAKINSSLAPTQQQVEEMCEWANLECGATLG